MMIGVGWKHRTKNLCSFPRSHLSHIGPNKTSNVSKTIYALWKSLTILWIKGSSTMHESVTSSFSYSSHDRTKIKGREEKISGMFSRCPWETSWGTQPRKAVVSQLCDIPKRAYGRTWIKTPCLLNKRPQGQSPMPNDALLTENI